MKKIKILCFSLSVFVLSNNCISYASQREGMENNTVESSEMDKQVITGEEVTTDMEEGNVSNTDTTSESTTDDTSNTEGNSTDSKETITDSADTSTTNSTDSTNSEATKTDSKDTSETDTSTTQTDSTDTGKTDTSTTQTDITDTTDKTDTSNVTLETTQINAKEIDLGDYLETMAIGEKQLILATVLPMDTTDQILTYKSSNEDVATINGMGRITAIAAGTTKITVKCGKAKNYFKLTVKKSNDIEVSDIEIGNYEEEMTVDQTQTISATVLPSDATDSIVKYASSDNDVATVLSTGEVKAIGKGTTIITVKAGEIKKEIEIAVKVATTKINVNNNYVVLKPEEEFKLKASALPSDASQTMTFESADKEVASVSSNGTISAKSIGTTSVIISNGDLSTAVTVIVNESGSADQTMVENLSHTVISNDTQNLSTTENMLIEKIKDENNSQEIEIEGTDYKIISKSTLKALYDTGKTIHIQYDDYSITLKGTDIVNYDNELNTEIKLKKEDKKQSFTINEEKNLPGLITLKLKDGNYHYLYLYNETKNKYQLLKVKDLTNLTLDTTGNYLLTVDKLNGITVSVIAIIVVGVIMLGLVITFIVVKKQYWFW